MTIHPACVGCYEIVPVTPGQLVSLALTGTLMVALFALVFLALDRFNR